MREYVSEQVEIISFQTNLARQTHNMSMLRVLLKMKSLSIILKA